MPFIFLLCAFSFFSACSSGSSPANDTPPVNDVSPDADTSAHFVAHYKTIWKTPYIHFCHTNCAKDQNWTSSPGKAMTAETGGWFRFEGDQWLGSIECVFNNGSGEWDSNGGANYKTALREFWIYNGKVYAENPGDSDDADGTINDTMLQDDDVPAPVDSLIPEEKPDAETDTTPDYDDPQTGLSSITWQGDTASVTCTGTANQTCILTTTAELRDNEPSSKQITITEKTGTPRLRSGSPLIDALFALALQEAGENSVEEIHDNAFNNGAAIPCSCFETGAKWPYVWTRDSSYAAYLGLAWVDPRRMKDSLLFKVSGLKAARGGGNQEIMQDTGSGGSWPVSTDRVVWALGAQRLLDFLQGTERTAFRDTAYQTLIHTIEHDRKYIYDPIDGLYRGEQSFLDWREQSYPSWTAKDTIHLAMSKTLSTNILHLEAIRFAAKLATEKGESTTASTYTAWADNLASAIDKHFWLESSLLYASMLPTYLDAAPAHKFDLLGNALAVLSGVGDSKKRAALIASYPHTGAGAPVIWPQQPLTRIYHNRAIWPFVTALYANAAKKEGNSEAAVRAFFTLIRGAALNLSNMENFEFITQKAYFSDGEYSGPVVNSRRQLWSVAGFISLFADTIFGMETSTGGIRFIPFMPRALRNDLFTNTAVITLQDIAYLGKKITVELLLPPLSDGNSGWFGPGEILLNGTVVNDGFIAPELLAETNTITISLNEFHTDSGTVSVTNSDDFRQLFAPKEPVMSAPVLSDGKIAVSWNAAGETEVQFSVYRNGILQASGLTTLNWIDPNSADWAQNTYCYSIASTYSASGTVSHRTSPQCFWGTANEKITVFGPQQFTASGAVNEHGKLHFADWGTPASVLTTQPLTVAASGSYLLQLEYASGRPIDTGITACFKLVTVTEKTSGTVVCTEAAAMPHLGANDWERWSSSSFIPVTLKAGTEYTVTISDLYNMSYFDHFSAYTGGAGGGTSGYNRVNLAGIKLLEMTR